MDFGSVPYAELNFIDFSLPPEPTFNGHVLPGERAADPRVYIGCPRWSVKEWVGKIFPKGTKDAQFLTEYAKQFNCIELNSTFYNIYNESTITGWAEKVKDRDFLFCPKVFQGISHEGTLTGKEELTQAFEGQLAALGKHLGPQFLQLNDRFGPQRRQELTSFLQAVSASLFVEVRHPDWFLPDELNHLVQLLEETGHGLLMTNTAGRRDACHVHLAQPKTMVRFVANNLHPTDYTRIDEWVNRIQHWIENGLSQLYFIIHMHNEKHSPELAGYMVDKLNAACGLQLKKPTLLQQELF